MITTRDSARSRSQIASARSAGSSSTRPHDRARSLQIRKVVRVRQQLWTGVLLGDIPDGKRTMKEAMKKLALGLLMVAGGV